MQGAGCNCDPSAVEEGWRGHAEMRRRPPPRGFVREQKGARLQQTHAQRECLDTLDPEPCMRSMPVADVPPSPGFTRVERRVQRRTSPWSLLCGPWQACFTRRPDWSACAPSFEPLNACWSEALWQHAALSNKIVRCA